MKKLQNPAIELLPILGCALLPLFFDLSYQINLYMIWEGAYRIYMGEVPYRDFGIPMGFFSWIIPALFFKMFGPTLFTLAKAQAFLNIISGLSFRWILLSLGASFQTRFLSILVFSLTFILGLYWPQYNHTVIVFQFVAFGFLFHYLRDDQQKYGWLFLIASCLFFTISFFTKQDAGGLGIVIGSMLFLFHAYSQKEYKSILMAALSLIILFALAIVPFLKFDFSYWFNYGQAPHYTRISIRDIIQIVMEESRWEKLYLVIVLAIFFIRIQKDKIKKGEILFTILVLGILIEAMIFQVTSYVPRDNNIFFHAFACSYIFYQLEHIQAFALRSTFLILSILVCIWWAEKYWKYIDRVIAKVIPHQPDKNVISINTYILEPEACRYYSDVSTWTESRVPSFNHVRMPVSTVEGIDRFLNRTNQLKTKPLVLNMSELTPLALETPFNLEKGPLWFHLGVGMFERELDFFNSRIESNYYDVVLYENIPLLNNFYPFPIREKLMQHYKLIDSFEAPRIVYPGTIEVYSRKEVF